MTELIRLNKYLDVVRNNLKTATGSLKEFWEREEKRTLSKIGKL
jgi:hypothetical protein